MVSQTSTAVSFSMDGSNSGKWAEYSAHVAADSHCGFVRSSNEDSFGYLVSPEKNVTMLAVADGVGGCLRGDLASIYTIKLLLSHWRVFVSQESNLTQEIVTQFLYSDLEKINFAVHRLGKSAGERMPMGTTLSLAVLLDSCVITANAGDSKVMRWRDGILEQLTDDHTVAAALMRAGKIRPEEVKDHPQVHTIVKSVGPVVPMNPDIRVHDRQNGDRFLVCSDGLISEQSDILQIMGSSLCARNAVQRLLNDALRKGGLDNVTLVAYV